MLRDMTTRPMTLRPSPGPRPAEFLLRAVFASMAHAAAFPNQARSAEALARARWGDDVTPIVLRTATGSATTGVPTWAGDLARQAVGDFLASLAPISAASRLFAAAPRVSLAGIQTLKFPARSGPLTPDQTLWVAEDTVGPVLRIDLTSATLGPAKKMLAFVVATRELLESSSAETIIATLLRENCAASLDTSLFSDLPETAARPAGALAGILPLTATTGGGDAAMTADLSALAAAISGSTGGLAYVAHPQQANAIRLRRGSLWPDDVPVWPTIGVAPGTVIALDPAAFASAFGDEAEISTSAETVLQMDTAPGDPLAGPSTKNLFQTDCTAAKVRLKAAWAWRATGCASWVKSVTW
jgi:hypothetical protein